MPGVLLVIFLKSSLRISNSVCSIEDTQGLVELIMEAYLLQLVWRWRFDDSFLHQRMNKKLLKIMMLIKSPVVDKMIPWGNTAITEGKKGECFISQNENK